MDTGQFLNRHALKCIFIGMVIGVMGMAFSVAGFEFAENSSFCGSCHSMVQAHASWQDSNHKQIACTECHLPNQNLAVKLIAKGQTGMNDMYHETIRDYPATIQVSNKGMAIVEDNCLRCHQSTVGNTKMAAGGQSCTKCHQGLIHGKDKSKGGIKIE